MNLSFLDNYTNEEIVSWINQNCYVRKPKESELLLIRWQIETERNMKRSEELTKSLESINFKKRDELAKKFNISKDIKEKLKLVEQMKPYHDKWNKYIKESEILRQDEARIQKIYNSIEKTRKLEKVD